MYVGSEQCLPPSIRKILAKAAHNWCKGTLTISDSAIQVKLAINNLFYGPNNSNTYFGVTSTQSDSTRLQESESMGVNVAIESAKPNQNFSSIIHSTKCGLSYMP